jgi:hypothetical protein
MSHPDWLRQKHTEVLRERQRLARELLAEVAGAVKSNNYNPTLRRTVDGLIAALCENATQLASIEAAISVDRDLRNGHGTMSPEQRSPAQITGGTNPMVAA